MSRDLNLLVSEFRAVVGEVLATCFELGVELRPYETLRDPWTQAKYWRQSRSIEEIQEAMLAQELEMPFIIEEALFEGQGDRSPRFKQDMDEWFGRGASGYMPCGFDGADVGDGHPGGVGGREHTDWPTLRNLFQTYAEKLADGL